MNCSISACWPTIWHAITRLSSYDLCKSMEKDKTSKLPLAWALKSRLQGLQAVDKKSKTNHMLTIAVFGIESRDSLKKCQCLLVGDITNPCKSKSAIRRIWKGKKESFSRWGNKSRSIMPSRSVLLKTFQHMPTSYLRQIVRKRTSFGN